MGIGDINKGLIDQLNKISNVAQKSSIKIASGKRINSAADDAAGLAVALSLESDVRVSDRAQKNAADGVSLVNIADSTLSNVGDITTRQQELALQAANGTYSDEQRQALNQEYQQLEQEKQRQLGSAEFNGTKIFGDQGTTLQVGSDGTPDSQIALPATDSSGIGASIPDISTAANATQALDDLNTKQANVADVRGQIGAVKSRIDIASSAAASRSLESATAASRITDVDLAEEVTNYTAANIRQQTSVAAVAHNNLNTQVVLKLLG